MRVAIVHEWLISYSGSERVLEQMLLCFPEADLFSLLDYLPEGQRGFIGNRPVKTSFIQKLPGAEKRYRSYLPLMPLAVEQLDLSGYDLIISSSHAVAKGVLTGPDQIHICYCHSPMRYAWDLQHQYLEGSGMNLGPKSWIARSILHYMRIWDTRTSNGVDAFIANSNFIARRIAKVYRRSAAVIYPPVEVSEFEFLERKSSFYLAASRMVPYKKMATIVEAFSSLPEAKLVVIGDGPEFENVKAKAGRNVELLGYQPTPVLRKYMQNAKGFIFAAEEDFGIMPLEAQACGTPVIAFGKGGALETIRGLKAGAHLGEGGNTELTGVFFGQQTAEDIAKAIGFFEQRQALFTPAACRQNAIRFSAERFRNEFKSYVENFVQNWGDQTACYVPLDTMPVAHK